MRRVIPALVVVGLAVGVVLLWPGSTTEEPPTTSAGPTTTSSSSTSVATTSTTTPATTTSTTVASGSHMVETVEEAEEILRSHYYRWFQGIYDQDEDLIRSTVVLDSQVNAAVQQFGTMEFEGEPSHEGLEFDMIEILRADSECTALWSVASASFRSGSSAGVTVFRWLDSDWKLLSSWQSKEDLWESDCDSSLS